MNDTRSSRVDILIIGAGVVGLAIAAELAGYRPELSVVLIDKHDRFGRETSSRNSEVIHAGIYYPAGSLKARLCVEGNPLLYSYCRQWGINHRRSGKLIAANCPDETESLLRLLAQAEANGVFDLKMLSSDQIKSLEPEVKAETALFSPSTGIVDSHALMARLEQAALQNGVLPAYCHQVVAVEPFTAGFRVYFQNPDGSADYLESQYLINSAGLQSDRIAAMAGIDTAREGYRLHLCKGEYFSLPSSKADLVNGLIYPPPLHELTGLGIHVTKTLDGRLRLGPNTIYIDKEEYSVDPAHGADFYRAVKLFLPFVELNDLEPEMAGIRPKLSGPGEPFRDFIICEESGRGLPGLINLVGIESPGLTCCLSIARLVRSFI
jgi:L-2-hydroxyglutarate oxidase LhgO